MNVLVVRLSAMGDVVHALPLAANLARAGHRVGWIVERPFAPLLECNPAVDRLFVVETRLWRRRPLASKTLGALTELRRQIAEFSPDVVLDPQANEKSLWASRLARAPRIVLDDRSVRSSWTRRWAASIVIPPADARHAVDKVLCLLSPLSVPVAQRQPDAGYLRAGAGRAAADFLALAPRPFALYHPGAGWGNKAWGEERFAALAREVERRTGVGPVISWGPGDEERAERLAGLVGAPRIPAVGFADLAKIISEARFFAAGDTGPLHLADALGIATLALFGPTDPARNGPYRKNGPTLFAGLPCAPCVARYNATKACLSMIDPAVAARSIAERAGG